MDSVLIQYLSRQTIHGNSWKLAAWALACLWLVLLAAIVLHKAEWQQQLPAPQFDLHPIPAVAQNKHIADEKPFFRRHMISSPADAPSVHAASIALIHPKHQEHHQYPKQLLAVWFAGAREGARDVQIFASRLDLSSSGQAMPSTTWSKPRAILSRQALEEKSATYIKKLGNPVIYQAQNGLIHLFVVGVSLGGWAGSRIYHLVSTDGLHYDFRQVLPLSPLMNISHLVRATPVTLADGGFYLPVYHEMLEKFELLLRFDAKGSLVGKMRINHLTGSLQPWLLPLSASDCLMVRRNTRTAPLHTQYCHQGGSVWDAPQPTPFINENDSLNAVSMDDGIFLIHNHSRQSFSRYYLLLSHLNNINAQRTTHNAQRTTHNAQRTTHNAQRTTHTNI